MHFSVFTYLLIRVKYLHFRLGFAVFILPACIFLLLQGCVLEQMDDCVQYELTVSAVDPQGNDVIASGAISTIDIYLFDENGFVRIIPREGSSDYLLGAEKNKAFTLVAWGNLKSDSLILPRLSVGTSLVDAKIELMQTANGYSLPITDLFYSRLEFNNTSTRAAQNNTLQLVMERLVTGMSVRVSNEAEYFGSVPGKLHLVVRGTGTSLNFLGDPSSDEAGYAPVMKQVTGKDEWVTPLFRVLPTSEDQHVSIDLYRDDNLLFTITRDDDGNILRTLPGKETYITVDFRYARLHVSASVMPWGSVGNQNVGL